MSSSEMDSNFEFYLRFVKPLILNLQKPEDRFSAAAWVQKLMDEHSGSEDLRTNYLKLLLFVLQRKKLRGIFCENPNQSEGLKQLSEANLHEVARDLLDAEKQIRESPESGDYPPYSTDYSTDLLEYSAVQYIPNFGVHAYYAISNEPLPAWDRTEKAVFPRGLVRKSTTHVKITSSRFSVTESAPSLDEQGTEANKPILQIRSRNIIKSQTTVRFHTKTRTDKPKHSDGDNMAHNETRSYTPKNETRGASPRREMMAKTPLATPLGSMVKENEGEIREAPVWGSNLIGVSKPPPPWHVPDIPERDTISFDSDIGASPACSLCRNLPKLITLPRRSRSPKTPSRCRQNRCNERRQTTCLPCRRPVSELRPCSAAGKENYYFSNYQANYFEAVSLSDANLQVEPICLPPENPSPMNRIRLLDIPYGGDMRLSREETSIPVHEGIYDLPHRSASPSRCINGVPRSRSPIPAPVYEGSIFPASMYEGNSFQVPPNFDTSVEREIQVYEPYQRIADAMGGQSFAEIQQDSKFMYPDQRAGSIAQPKGQTLPPIPEKEQEVRNIQLLRENQAEVDRIIRKTILNTQKIDQDLQAFDRFITEYEKDKNDI